MWNIIQGGYTVSVYEKKEHADIIYIVLSIILLFTFSPAGIAMIWSPKFTWSRLTKIFITVIAIAYFSITVFYIIKNTF
jgi:hypothetical protein